MTDTFHRMSILRLILIPSIITLAITLLRLVGELLHWSEWWFSRAPGGGGSPIGISWLAPVFGIYFAMRLARSGEKPSSNWRVIGFALLGILMLFGGGVVGFAPNINLPGRQVIGLVLIAAAALIQLGAWPMLTKVLLAYGYAARIPVAIVMFFAIRGQWGTHYDVLPPNYPPDMGFWNTYLQIGFLPQMVIWVAYTVVIGALFGGIAAALMRRSKPGSQAAAG